MFLPAIQTPPAQTALPLPQADVDLLNIGTGQGAEALAARGPTAKGAAAPQGSGDTSTDQPVAGVEPDFATFVFADGPPAPALPPALAEDTSIKAGALPVTKAPIGTAALDDQPEEASLGILPDWLKLALATAPDASEGSTRGITADIASEEKLVEVGGMSVPGRAAPRADPSPSIPFDQTGPGNVRATAGVGLVPLDPVRGATAVASEPSGAPQAPLTPAAPNKMRAVPVLSTVPATGAENQRATLHTTVAAPAISSGYGTPSPAPTVPPPLGAQPLDAKGQSPTATPEARLATFPAASAAQIQSTSANPPVGSPLTDQVTRAQGTGQADVARALSKPASSPARPAVQRSVTPPGAPAPPDKRQGDGAIRDTPPTATSFADTVRAADPAQPNAAHLRPDLASSQSIARDGAATEGASGRDPVTLPQLQASVTQRLLALIPPPLEASESVRMDPAQPRTAEVELAPAELGKLKLTLQTTERGLHLIVAVERPEAIDAVRRHLETLHRALLSEGVTLDGVDIGTGSQRQDQASAQDEDAPHLEADRTLPETATEGPAPAAARPVSVGHLDLSL